MLQGSENQEGKHRLRVKALPICYRKGFLSSASGDFSHTTLWIRLSTQTGTAYILRLTRSGTRGWIIFIHHLCSTLSRNLAQFT